MTMRPQPVQHQVTLNELATFASVRDPLRHWLRESHGRWGVREGVLGAMSAAVALIALLVYDFSPLIVMLHLLIALLSDSIAAVVAARRVSLQPARPFFSPAHALAFVGAVIDAFARPRGDAPRGQIGSDLAPYARGLAPASPKSSAHDSVPANGAEAGKAARAASGIAAIVIWLIVMTMVTLLWIVPLVRATMVLFEPSDWIGLAALLAINGAQIGSAWRGNKSTVVDAPWHHSWFADEMLSVSRLIYWKHCKQLQLFLAFIIFVLLLLITGPATVGATGDDHAYTNLYEANLRPTVIALFAMSGVLHLLLLAAPWQARRLIARIDAFDLDAASAQATVGSLIK